jgi:hypothetical protein
MAMGGGGRESESERERARERGSERERYAEWIVIRRPLRDHNNTAFGRPTPGWPISLRAYLVFFGYTPFFQGKRIFLGRTSSDRQFLLPMSRFFFCNRELLKSFHQSM